MEEAKSVDLLSEQEEVQVVLETQDGYSVSAHSSRVFEGWRLSGVTLRDNPSASPSPDGLHILLPSISARGLLPTLEFIYTDTFTWHALTTYNVIDVLHAARFFIIPRLEHLAFRFFCNRSVDQLARARFKLLSSAVAYLSPLLDCYIFRRLHETMVQFQDDIPDVVALSPQALHFYLKTSRDPAIEVSESAYARLRLVLIWCAQASSPQAKEALQKYLPAQQAKFLACCSFAHSVQHCDLLKELKPHRSSMRACSQPWLPYLDLYRVHPEVLARVVEPLGIIPDSCLTHTFRFHARFFKDMLVLQWRGGVHHPRYALQGDGCVIKSVIDDKLFGFCATGTPITSLMGICEWDFIIEEACSYLGIGFCSVKALAHVKSDTMWLGYRSYGWVLSCHGDLYHTILQSESNRYSQKFGDGARVRVQVDVAKGICRFIVDGEACGVAWNDIPSKIYPAVTMGYPGRVRIELARTEDKEKLLAKLLEVAGEAPEAT